MRAQDIEAIRKRLDVLIALLLQTITKDGRSLSGRDQIRILANLGMRPVEIAEILARPQGYVGKELAVIRRKSGK